MNVTLAAYAAEVSDLAARWEVPPTVLSAITEPMVYAAWRRRTAPAYFLASCVVYLTAR